MNMGTLIPLLILIVVLFFVIRSMVRDKKAGKSLSCGQSCSNCPHGASCPSQMLKNDQKASSHSNES